ncbi:MAG TPA: GlsB/YeaQ/YmgE family stress response membrane protein [Vitreimonas sp.]|nr:GlsB/YeaQ/YmgE family stress response membrane protein [Vitreimonas sp.]
MGILLFIALGLVAGYIASVVMRTNDTQGTLGDIALGVIGAIVGGFVMNMMGEPGVSGFNLYSLFVATLGAIALIWVGRVLAR